MAKTLNVAYKRSQRAFFGREVLWTKKSGFSAGPVFRSEPEPASIIMRIPQ